MNPSPSRQTVRLNGPCQIGAVPIRGMVFFLFLLLMTFTIPTSSRESLYTISDLEALTNEELEDICIQRGFGLIKDTVDPETGEVYNLQREDYIEAAQRCLMIEQEM